MKIITNTSRFGRIHIEMIRAIVNFALVILANIPITGSIPGWKALMIKLQSKLAEIDSLIQQKSLSLKGYAQQKKELKASLVQISTSIMNAVYNYAINTNNNPLKDAMLTSQSKLEKLNYGAIVTTAQAAFDMVLPIVGSLAPYDVDQTKLDAWQKNIKDLRDVLTTVKNFYSERKRINESLQSVLRDAMTMINQECDTFITSFKENNANYFNDYWANRKLQPLTVHTKFKVTVLNDINQGVFGVKVQQNGTKDFATTDMNGNATLQVKVKKDKKAQPVYSFTLTSGAHTLSTGNIEIKLGYTVSKTYTMQQSGFVIPESAPQTATVIN